MGLFATLGNLSNEVIIKHKTKESQGLKQSIFAQNIMLYSYSSVVAVGFWIYQTKMEESFFHQWDYKTLFVIALQVSSGSTIAFVLKYLSNITYTVINTLSIVVTSVVAALLFGDELTFDFIMASTFVVMSAYMMYNR
uniref:Uncharacterized protein n=1 Tax=Pyramimonas obovata TaxID=1411642 RepID=A0A7S0N795_9CHLO